MRYLFGFLCVCALVASPLSVSAQDGDKERLEDFYPGTLPESPQVSDEDRLGDFYPEPAPEEPALQLKLDDAGVEVVPSGYVEMKLRQRASKARTWLIATGVLTAIGVPLLVVGATYDRRQPPSEGFDFDLDFTGVALATVGGIMVFVGVFGMAVSGGTLGASKRKLRRLQQAHYEGPRRVQWDLAQSRLVF